MAIFSFSSPPLQACRRAAGGFTLIELMVVLVVLGTILAVATPAMSSFISTQQVKAVSFDLTTDLLLARNEALKRNASVTISRNDGDWANGWRVVASGGDDISARNAPQAPVQFTNAPDSITFDVNGRVSAPSTAVRITLGSTLSGVLDRCVQLDLAGRAKTLTGACS